MFDATSYYITVLYSSLLLFKRENMGAHSAQSTQYCISILSFLAMIVIGLVHIYKFCQVMSTPLAFIVKQINGTITSTNGSLRMLRSCGYKAGRLPGDVLLSLGGFLLFIKLSCINHWAYLLICECC